MILLELLSGQKAGNTIEARQFPFRLGRSPGSDLVLEDDGVWDRHLAIELDPDQGFHLRARPECFVALNGQRVDAARLANGDLISFGAIQIRFSLSPPRQRSQRPREVLTWMSLALVGLAQIALIYWLLERA